MKLRLLILLAAALAAAPATAQTIKSLGYNTTNGQIVYSGTNALTFTNALQFSTNAQAATRTNLGGTTVGNAVFTATNTAAAQVAIFGTNADINTSGGLVGLTLSTNETKLLNPISFPFLGGATAAATSLTNLGLGATNSVTFSNITANGILNANDSTATPATNAAAAQGIQWSGLGGSQHAAIYGGYSGTAQIALAVGASSNALSDVATFRSTGMTVSSNAIVGGTLAVTGNVTMSGLNNTMPNATNAASASSLMTRALGDDRYRIFYVPLVHALTSTAANGSTWNLRPFHSSDAVFSVPPWARNVRVYLSTGFTNAPVSNNFTAVITVFQLTTSNSFGIPWGATTNAFSVTSVWSNGSNSHRFIFGMTNDIALTSDGIADAESANFWNILIQLRNDSSASLTTVPDNWLRGMAVFTD